MNPIQQLGCRLWYGQQPLYPYVVIGRAGWLAWLAEVGTNTKRFIESAQKKTEPSILPVFIMCSTHCCQTHKRGPQLDKPQPTLNFCTPSSSANLLIHQTCQFRFQRTKPSGLQVLNHGTADTTYIVKQLIKVG